MFKKSIWLMSVAVAIYLPFHFLQSEDLKKLPESKDLNVIVIVVDTLAQKHTATYTGESFTPEIDKFAKESVVFSNAYSTAPWTIPSIASILTGLMPSQHGMKRLNQKLNKEIHTLPEAFKELGHKTYSVYSHTLLKPKYGFAQGFDVYINAIEGHKPHIAVSSKWVTDHAIEQLKKHQTSNPEAPFFFFLHYFDPHFFYQEHKEFKLTDNYQGKLKPGLNIRVLRDLSDSFKPEDTEYLVNLHHEEIAYTDKHLGRLFAYLEASGRKEDTLVVLTADHGEEFMEHQWLGHTKTLYQELINVPFMISLPGTIIPGQTEVLMSSIDIAPTLLRENGDPRLRGINLAPYLTDQKKFSQYPERNLIAEVDFKSSKRNKDAKIQCIIKDNFKLIHDQDKDSYQLFSIKNPEDEYTNLATKNQKKTIELKKALIEWRKSLTEKVNGSEVQIDDKEIEQLKSLGYM